MYTQFFGNYLLSNNVVTSEQLLSAIARLKQVHVRLGTIAMHKGMMTASEVDECCYLQMREDKRFGEIAVNRGYLTDDQVADLLSSQEPDYILLGQTLVEDGALTNSDLERLMNEYQLRNEILENEITLESKELIQDLIRRFFVQADMPVSEELLMYLNLLFNNLIRFIGEDFTPLNPYAADSYSVNYCVMQSVIGRSVYNSHIDMDESLAIAFASRYAKEEFTEFDEYVQASLEDFLNLHNGLFVVNMSNEFTYEMTLEPPVHVDCPEVSGSGRCVVVPVAYPFGTINFILTT